MKQLKFYRFTGWLLLALFLSVQGCRPKSERLPFLSTELVDKMENGKLIQDTVPKVIPPFSLRNQDSLVLDNSTFAGKIYVADFFFTTCPTICPVMHRNLLSVYQQFADEPRVMFLSHTIDVKYDTPSRLKAYAGKLGIDTRRWQFAWGTRDSIYNLAQKHYLVSVGEERAAPGGFVHQGYLVLVDGKGRIRGAYDGTVEAEAKKLSAGIRSLLAEEEDSK
ncbi:SCO family protein [Pedobacter yulinensis]|uniref:SCO family protein n=1 Tax=Pedobacter yulinensis TaxID=2126353 RepID=A0A2T3HKJ7_9SPHI|nr:SCO family protein [Pedobacter yulinensis]PST82911.1 SCO family protein [Pedobacter yulinensis]